MTGLSFNKEGFSCSCLLWHFSAEDSFRVQNCFEYIFSIPAYLIEYDLFDAIILDLDLLGTKLGRSNTIYNNSKERQRKSQSLKIAAGHRPVPPLS